jgi:hypothetical protein
LPFKEPRLAGWFWNVHAVSSKYFAVMTSANLKFKMMSLEDDAGIYPQYFLNFHRFDSNLTLFNNVSANIVTIYRTTFPVFFNMVEDRGVASTTAY